MQTEHHLLPLTTTCLHFVRYAKKNLEQYTFLQIQTGDSKGYEYTIHSFDWWIFVQHMDTVRYMVYIIIYNPLRLCVYYYTQHKGKHTQCKRWTPCMHTQHMCICVMRITKGGVHMQAMVHAFVWDNSSNRGRVKLRPPPHHHQKIFISFTPIYKTYGKLSTTCFDRRKPYAVCGGSGGGNGHIENTQTKNWNSVILTKSRNISPASFIFISPYNYTHGCA